MKHLMPETTGNTEQLATALRAAGERLESLHQQSDQLRQQIEEGQWSGIDEYVNSGQTQLKRAEDQLQEIADRVGMQGQILRDAREAYRSAGERETIV